MAVTRQGAITRDKYARQIGIMQIRAGKSAPNIATTTPVFTTADSLGAFTGTGVSLPKEFHDFKSGFPAMTDLKIPLSADASIKGNFLELTPKNFALANGIDPFADQSAGVIEGNTNSASGVTVGDITVTDTAGPVMDRWTVFFTTAATGEIIGEMTGHVHAFTDLASVMAPDNAGNPYFSLPANFFDANWTGDESFTFTTSPYEAGTATYADSKVGSIGFGTFDTPAMIRVEAVIYLPNQYRIVNIIPMAQVTASVEYETGESEAAIPLMFSSSPADQFAEGGNAVWNAMPLGQQIWMPPE